MKVLILYFSATGNTAKMAAVIEERLTEAGGKVTMSNITSYTNRQEKLDLSPYDAIVFGSPVHSRRAPRVVREWLRTIDGQGKKCAMFFTYGGFGVHPAHYSTREILEGQHFRVVSSAAFLGMHTFNLGGWKAMEGRPDERDFDIAKAYVERTYKRFSDEDESLLGESGEADKGKCIACLACVANCPENVLKINDTAQSWSFKLGKEKVTEESLKKQKSVIYD